MGKISFEKHENMNKCINHQKIKKERTFLKTNENFKTTWKNWKKKYQKEKCEKVNLFNSITFENLTQNLNIYTTITEEWSKMVCITLADGNCF